MRSDTSFSMEETSNVSDGVTNFRIYSDRKCDPAIRVWNPNMDLLLSLHSGGPVSVNRLLADEAEDNSVLLTEQLPFEATAAAWHPSGRALAVGDEEGNVFILNADAEEERRIREIQKLNGTAVASLQWVPFSGEPRKLPEGLFSTAKLPFEGTNHAADPSSESILVSLSVGGHAAYIADSLIPLADVKLPKEDDEHFCVAALSSSGRHLAAVARGAKGCKVWIVDNTALSAGRHDICEAIRYQRDIMNLLKTVYTVLETGAIIWKSCAGEFRSKLADVDVMNCIQHVLSTNINADSKLKDALIEVLTPAKLVKWEKDTIASLDSLLSTFLIKADIALEKIYLLCLEMQALGKSRFAFLGTADANDKLVAAVKLLRGELRVYQIQLQNQGASLRGFFQLATFWFGGPLPDAQLLSALSVNFIPTTELPPDASLRESIKMVEISLHALVTDQRQNLSESLICSAQPFILGTCSSSPEMQWRADESLNMFWIESPTKLHIAHVSISGVGKKAVIDLELQGSLWNCVSAYSEDEVCLIVTQSDGLSSISLLDLREVEMHLVELENIGSSSGCLLDVYQLYDAVRPQQLPGEFCRPDTLCTSSSRRLASVFAAGRLLTLDMQPDDEEEN